MIKLTNLRDIGKHRELDPKHQIYATNGQTLQVEGKLDRYSEAFIESLGKNKEEVARNLRRLAGQLANVMWDEGSSSSVSEFPPRLQASEIATQLAKGVAAGERLQSEDIAKFIELAESAMGPIYLGNAGQDVSFSVSKEIEDEFHHLIQGDRKNGMPERLALISEWLSHVGRNEDAIFIFDTAKRVAPGKDFPGYDTQRKINALNLEYKLHVAKLDTSNIYQSDYTEKPIAMKNWGKWMTSEILELDGRQIFDRPLMQRETSSFEQRSSLVQQMIELMKKQ